MQALNMKLEPVESSGKKLEPIGSSRKLETVGSSCKEKQSPAQRIEDKSIR